MAVIILQPFTHTVTVRFPNHTVVLKKYKKTTFLARRKFDRLGLPGLISTYKLD